MCCSNGGWRMSEPFDLFIIGGGINGVGIARDAAGRGLKVMLVEQDDLASKTSSASSKLIHGGLRYLEHYEFRLVREALGERETLLKIAPHIIWPMTFVLPHDRNIRPAWMIRAGLFLYDHLAGRVTLPASRQLNLSQAPEGAGIKPGVTTGFSYADCWVDDARLVVLNALDACERGAVIKTRMRFVSAERVGDEWRIVTRNESGALQQHRARMLVNAAGPWVQEVLRKSVGASSSARIRMVKGSHIVVPALHKGSHAFILQNPDKRIIFVIPYEGEYSLIGTTDVVHQGDASTASISQEERLYLCESASRFMARAITPVDIVWDFAGVRPLYDDDNAADASKVTRDYVFDLQCDNGRVPMLNIYGGKITTYRRLAEHALEQLAPWCASTGPAWSGASPLPGGDLGKSFESFVADLQKQYAFLPPPLVHRYARGYGTRTHQMLQGVANVASMGEHFGAGLYECEVDYLMRHEWAVTTDDILWRRTKRGLHGGTELVKALSAYLQDGSFAQAEVIRA